MFLKNILKETLSKASPYFRNLFFYEYLVIKNCRIAKRKNTFFSKFINFVFWNEYYTRPLALRTEIQGKLMGGIAGRDWASYYGHANKEYPPQIGSSKIGNLDWYDACPSFKRVLKIMDNDSHNICFIQLGASSGKEILYFAKKYPKADFIYTDIYESVTNYAATNISLPNLKFVTCPAESLPALAEICNKKRVIIFSSGSSQYVFPENLDYTFSLFSNIKNKEIEFIFDEPGNNLNSKNISFKGSSPRGNFSYTHNYKYYAEKNNFKTYKWEIIKPFEPQGQFYPDHQGTIHLSGWFRFYSS